MQTKITKNPAGVKIDWKAVESTAEQIIEYIRNLRQHIMDSIDKLNVSSALKAEIKDRFTVGKLNAMSMRQALLSVFYPQYTGRILASQQFNNSSIDTGIKIPLTIHTKNKDFSFNTSIRLQPFKRQRAGKGRRWINDRMVFETEAYAYSPITGAPLRDFLSGKRYPLSSYICVGVSSEMKYADAIENLKIYEKTTRISLRDTLAHEVTHIQDPLIELNYPKLPSRTSLYTEQDWKDYYNAPAEVKARVNELISVVRAHPEEWVEFDDLIKNKVKKNPFWRYLTDENKRFYLASLYAEWDKLKPSQQKISEFQRRKQAMQAPLNIFRYLGATLGGGRYIQQEIVQTPVIEPLAPQLQDRPEEKRDKIQGRGRKKYEPKRLWQINYGSDANLYTTAGIYSIVRRMLLNSGYQLNKCQNEIRSPYNLKGGIDWDGDYQNPPELTKEAAWIRFMDEKLECPVGWQTEVNVENDYESMIVDLNITRVA